MRMNALTISHQLISGHAAPALASQMPVFGTRYLSLQTLRIRSRSTPMDMETGKLLEDCSSLLSAIHEALLLGSRFEGPVSQMLLRTAEERVLPSARQAYKNGRPVTFGGGITTNTD